MFNNRINIRILLSIVATVFIYHSSHGLTINGLIYDVNTEQGTAICTGGASHVQLVIPKTIPHPSGKEIEVIGISPSAFQNNSSIYDLIINANLSYIGANAFKNCRNLEIIEFNGNVLQCRNSAFAKCSSLSQITFPCDNITIGDSCFYECTQLKTITLSHRTKTIGKYAFANCSSLSNISLGDSIQTIGNYAFTQCNLTSIDFPKTVEAIGESAFYKAFYISTQSAYPNTYEVSIPNKVKKIGANAFDGNPIASIIFEYGELPIEIETTSFTDYPDFSQRKFFETTLFIGRPFTDKNEPFRKSKFVRKLHIACNQVKDYQFEGCENLTSLSFSDCVKSIGRSAFAGCKNLTYQLHLKGVETIGEYAFYGCGRIIDLDFYEGLKSIGEYTFAYCDSIPYIRIPPHLKIIPKNCFAYTAGHSVEFLSSTDTLEVFSLPRSIENVEMNRPLTSRSSRAVGQMLTLKYLSCGGTITSIPNEAFYNCQASSVRLSEGIESIGDEAFARSHNLRRIYLPNSVKSIGVEAFNNCTGLREIELGDSLKYIGRHCFESNSLVSSIKCASSVPPVVDGEDVFSDDVYNNAQLIVNYPSGVLYKEALGWRNFLHIKEPMPEIDSIRISKKYVETELDKGFFLSCKVFPSYLGWEDNIRWYVKRVDIAGYSDTGLKIDKQDDGLIYVSSSHIPRDHYIICEHKKSESSKDYYSDTCYVKIIRPELTSISLIGESKIYTGGENRLMYSIDYENDHHIYSEFIHFSILNLTPDIITLHKKGDLTNYNKFDVSYYDDFSFIVYGDKAGIGKIRVSDRDNPDNFIIVELECISNITDLSFAKTDITVDVNERTTLRYCYNVINEVSKTDDLLSIDTDEGVYARFWSNDDVEIVGLKPGKWNVTLYSKDGSNLSVTCHVTVRAPEILVSSISLSPSSVEDKEGEQIQITATVLPEDATNKTIRWSSSDENIASVDDSGLISLHKKGTAVITASATDESGISAECAVVVTELSGIEDVLTDKSAYVKIFDLKGVLIFEGIYAEANLAPDYYIVVCGGKSAKVKVK